MNSLASSIFDPPWQNPLSAQDLEPVFVRIKAVFDQMQGAYDQAARETGFQCDGCLDSCCKTLFFHHTLAEVLFLARGCALLPNDVWQQALERARNVCKVEEAHGNRSDPLGQWCPLCADGRCLTYAHRPMICRMHGVAYKLVMPNGVERGGPGCLAFEEMAAAQARGRALDRTPFYRELARLEQDLRREAGFGDKIRLTVARILVNWSPAVEWLRRENPKEPLL